MIYGKRSRKHYSVQVQEAKKGSSAKLVPCGTGKKGTVLPKSKPGASLTVSRAHMPRKAQMYREVNPRWQHHFKSKLILTPCYAEGPLPGWV